MFYFFIYGFLRGNIYTSCIFMVLLDHFANKSNTFLFFFSLPLSFSHFLLGSSLPPIPDTRIPHLKAPWLGMIIVLFLLPSAWFLAPCINGNLALIQQAKKQRKRQIRRQKRLEYSVLIQRGRANPNKAIVCSHSWRVQT